MHDTEPRFSKPPPEMTRSPWDWMIAFVGFVVLVGILSWVAISQIPTINQQHVANAPPENNPIQQL